MEHNVPGAPTVPISCSSTATHLSGIRRCRGLHQPSEASASRNPEQQLSSRFVAPAIPQRSDPITVPLEPNPPKPLGPYNPTLIIHGGAGAITRESLPPELYAKYHASLQSYLISTQSFLHAGGTAIDAACHAVSLLEDDPLFNCGRGSVFNLRGTIEMEASLAVTSIDADIEYQGKVKHSAAVSMLSRTRHPILLARELLLVADEDKGIGGLTTMHGHLSRREAEKWGYRRGLEWKARDWFWTKRRWEEHKKGLKDVREEDGRYQFLRPRFEEKDELADLKDVLVLPSQGTVGAVCMDSWGVIAVATSTGGLTNKQPGRIGDTPTVGAGFWAESWLERIKEDLKEPKNLASGSSVSWRLAMAAKAEVDFWLGDCLAPSGFERVEEEGQKELSESKISRKFDLVEHQPLIHHKHDMVYSKPAPTRRRAVAMSGTGNGDSFLRTTACRTAAAISRYSSTSLEQAFHDVSGPDGELQRSAGNRWGRTGEGQGGIIGIEMMLDSEGRGEGKAVFDFNCGGLWRAYYEQSDDGKQTPRVMVFREDYGSSLEKSKHSVEEKE